MLTSRDRWMRHMLPEPIAVTRQVIDALEQVGAAYMIGGALASTIHDME